MIDYPCSWQAYTHQQIHWNDIAVETDIDYSYGEMLQVMKAAEATNSSILVTWWSPEPSINNYLRVTLPKATSECIAKRSMRKSERCTLTQEELNGESGSGCDGEGRLTDKFFAKSLKDEYYNKPKAARSPAYPFLDKFQISETAVDEILNDWKSGNFDNGYNSRQAVCNWVVDNIDDLSNLRQYIPTGYPRNITEKVKPAYQSIMVIALSACVTMIIFAMIYATYRYRRSQVILYAQPQFLYLFLVGYLGISLSAIFYGISPSNATCITREWLVLLGYTLGNVPLLVKTTAINSIMQNAKKMKRVKISQKKLFLIVGVSVSISIIYLICWMIINPSQKETNLIMVSEKEGNVDSISSCSSNCLWNIIAYVWEGFYIFCSAVLAVQSRNIAQEFNESKNVRNMAYASFLFFIFRMILVFVPLDLMYPETRDTLVGIVLCFDALANLLVYFAPKFWKIYTGFSAMIENRRHASQNINSTPHGKSHMKSYLDPGVSTASGIEDFIVDGPGNSILVRGKSLEPSSNHTSNMLFVCRECKRRKNISEFSSDDTSSLEGDSVDDAPDV